MLAVLVVSWAAWYGLTFILISVTIALISIAYMLGIGFNLPKLQAWAKDELYQALASALIAVLLISLASTISATMTSIYGRDQFAIATDYIKAMVANLATTFFSVAYTDAGFALMESMVYRAMPSQMGFDIDPFGGMAVLTSLLSMIMETILGGMSIMIGQGTFLMFIGSQLPLVLAIGIALRSFPFTRAAGGALIAVFLGFYIFYPFLWVFDSYLYNEIRYQPLIGAMGNVGSVANTGFSNIAGSTSGCSSDLQACATNTVSGIGSSEVLALVDTVGYYTVYNIFIFVFILSLFNLLTTLVLTNELAKIFGAEIDLQGLGGLI